MRHLSAAIALSLTVSTSIAQPTAAPPTMKAVRFHEYGPATALKLEDVPRPTPGEDEILVKVHAAGVNPVDAKIRAGSLGKMFKLPLTPGFDVSGVVESVGTKVTRFKAGDEVFAYLSLMRGGAYAEYSIVKEGEAAMKPAKLTHGQAAAVPLAALTAWQALIDTAKLAKGQSILIHGGSGGVGSFAIQIAKARGAKVYATASAKNLKLLKDLGADEAIDYADGKFEDRVKDVDAVLDPIGGETQTRSLSVLKKGGILVSIVQPPDPKKAVELGVRSAIILVKPSSAQLAEISSMIDAGSIKPEISLTLPLADAAKAHEQIETGHTRGKIVLKIVEGARK
jgi:NADPH:quinone reductase-like Zn-dependent oxidoreductase